MKIQPVETRPIVFHAIRLCDDCAMLIANATLGNEDERADEAHAALITEIWGDTRLVVEGQGEAHFSKWPCDGCGQTLAGNRRDGWWQE